MRVFFKKIVTRISDFIGGNVKDFPLEHRLFNILVFLTVILSFLGAFHNFVLGLSSLSVYPSVIAGLICSYLYYQARKRKIFHAGYVILLAAMAIFIISIVFFNNSGSSGPIIILQLCIFNILILISSRKYQLLVLLLLLVNVFLLYFFEYLHPEWVLHYKNNSERFWDVLATFTYSALFMLGTTIIFKNKYNSERKKVEHQNKELSELYNIINSQKEALERKKTELENSLAEIQHKNEFILSLTRELNHRVKNNLQIVTSLLNMQESRIKNKHAKQVIKQAKNRIISIGLIHQKLYRDGLDLEIELSEYIRELAEYIVNSSLPEFDVIMVLKLEKVKATVEKSVHVGLIVNEIITNSIKHAWNKNSVNKQIMISSCKKEDGIFLLNVADNGTGFKNKMPTGCTKTFGLRLIRSIVDQYDGELQLENNKGAVIEIKMNFL